MTDILQKNWSTDQGFESLFKDLYAQLYRYASGILSDDMQAEEVVQDVFLKLWQQREQISIEINVQSYLYRAVHNHCMNILNHRKVKEKYLVHARSRTAQYAISPAESIYANELKANIVSAMAKIPEKCRAVFHLSRQEELSYREIAERLGISVKTVENQISKALRILREELKDHIPFMVFLILTSILN